MGDRLAYTGWRIAASVLTTSRVPTIAARVVPVTEARRNPAGGGPATTCYGRLCAEPLSAAVLSALRSAALVTTVPRQEEFTSSGKAMTSAVTAPVRR